MSDTENQVYEGEEREMEEAMLDYFQRHEKGMARFRRSRKITYWMLVLSTVNMFAYPVSMVLADEPRRWFFWVTVSFCAFTTAMLSYLVIRQTRNLKLHEIVRDNMRVVCAAQPGSPEFFRATEQARDALEKIRRSL
jgi:hypothetical protein